MKPFLLCILILLPGTSSMAQDAAFIEVFGGYSNLGLALNPSNDRERVGLNGWHSNISVNVMDVLELEADLSGHYGKINGRNVNHHTFMFGPRLSYDSEKINLYAHLLYGFSRLSGEGDVLTPFIQAPSDSITTYVPFLGGGFEININKKLAYRVVQFDLVIANWKGIAGLEHPRFSTGIVFKIGN
jgi:hypothetical protein